ncbi:MAG TPA: NAD(P)/FAD-dependent oxidoreductase [Gemmatimonadaceae bacterium]|nr:NAD(P)/FAD-dependent oxidoreductase [Gemmatimonadaceae bacterium]
MSSVRDSYDVAIIGGGHNGLVAAAYLARAGRRVLVLERREVLGGAAVTEEIVPGFKFSVFSYVVSLLRPEIIRDLELPRHGLHVLPLESTFTPLPDGDYLATWADQDLTRREIARHSQQDAEVYEEYSRQMALVAMAVKPLLSMVPPDPTGWSLRDWHALVDLNRHVRSLDEETFRWLYRLMTMSSADFLDMWFECDPLKATKSASGIIGTFMGPRTPGSAYVLLHHYMGEIDGVFRAWGFAKGGTGSISEAIASAARHFGAEIRLGAEVVSIEVRDGKVCGVVLSSGQVIRAKAVASSLDPKRTFLGLLDPACLPSEFVEDIRKYKTRGSSGKVNLALSELPRFSALPEDGPHLRGAISISPSLEYVERAYDDAKHGRFSRRPYMDIVIPSKIDPSMAPPSCHVMSIFVQYAPSTIDGGWTEAKKEAFGEAVIRTLEEFAPGIRKAIVGMQVLTPADIEAVTGLTDGNIFQGELALHQLFFLRPAPFWSRYRTPLKGLWLCGSAAHPGGGIMGAPGRLAAKEILRAGL